MSKKMKRVAFDSHQYVDDRARFKHQTLVQDFMELQQETQAARNNLLALKQKKLTLQAEVRFLRRRHKFLSQNKSATLQKQVFMNAQPARFIKSKKDEVHIGKQKTLHNSPPVGKKKTARSILSPEFDTILVKQQSLQRAIASRRVRINGPKRPPLHDLRQKDISGSQEHLGQSRSQTQKPVMDLNQISREEGLQDHHQRFESPTHGLFKSVGGDSGSGSGSGSGLSGLVGKRKISWQDPVTINSGLY